MQASSVSLISMGINEEANMAKTSPQFLYIHIFFSIGIRRESHGFIIKFGAVESWLKMRKATLVSN